MFFQPTLLNDESFAARMSRINTFPEHWHSDIEIVYCMKGSFGVRMRKAEYLITAGELIFIGGCEPHEIISVEPDSQTLIINAGSLFCGSENFKKITEKRVENPIVKNDKETNDLIKGIIRIVKAQDSVRNSLELRGRVYMLISLLLGKVRFSNQISDNHQKRLLTIVKIQQALDLVATRYNENLTLDDVALVSGYEKSAFCRMFRSATNYSFHKYLNDYRINKALILLEENHCSIAEIAYQVGFSQQKNFCRIFKESMGITPSEYRKKHY